MMRKIFILLGIFALFSACEENEKGTVILSDKVRLMAEIEDGTVFLKWNRPYVMEFRYYMVVRSSRPISDGGFYEEISRIYDFDEPTYEDSSFPLNEKMYYMVVAVGTNNY